MNTEKFVKVLKNFAMEWQQRATRIDKLSDTGSDRVERARMRTEAAVWLEASLELRDLVGKFEEQE